MKTIKYLSLFSGIGGFEYGISKVFGQEAECIGFSEIDEYAISVYRRWYPTHPALGSVTDIDTETLPDFDLLVGGFPCQAFSVCGQRRGFEDTRGTMFFEIARILRDKQPKYFLLENVKGLLSHKGGETFTTIIDVLTDIGYVCQSELVNSRFCGVPQNRERVFIFGVRGGGRPKVFPFRYTEEGTNDRPQGVSTCLDANYYKGISINGKQGKCRQLILHNVYGGFNESKPRVFEDYSPTVRTPQGGGHIPMVARLSNKEEDTEEVPQPSLPYDQEAGDQEVQQVGKGAVVALTERRTEEAKAVRREALKRGKDWCPRRGKELTARTDDATGTITTGVNQEQLLYDLNKADIRTLTPIEAERLQGFPDAYTHKGVVDYKTVSEGCTKRTVVAIIKKGNKLWCGTNKTELQVEVCPKTWLGEPFDVCKKTCGENIHAEIDALKKAGKNAKGATLYLIGHTFLCPDCERAVNKAGIKRVIFGKVPRQVLSNTRRFHAIGNAVTTNVIEQIMARFKEVHLCED